MRSREGVCRLTYTMPETHTTYNGKKYQTSIITHTGYRRIVKFEHATEKKVKDEVKLFKNHSEDCRWCDK